MKDNVKIAETTIEAPAKDIKTLKATNAIGKDDVVKVTDETKPTNTSTTTKPMYEESVDGVIQPQDQETIKYLSNVKDSKTGEISKPFTIKGKNYQMIRGMKPNKEIVMAVYCLDEMDEAGSNKIHSMEYFEENIAKKAIAEETKNNPWAICTASVGREDKDKYERCVMDIKKQHGISETMTEEEYNADNFNSDERDFHDKENLRATEKPVEPKAPVAPSKPQEKKVEETGSPNLSEFKHYFVDKNTGKFRKFKTNEELAKAVMGENESYMGLSEFKNFFTGKLFGSRQKSKEELSEVEVMTDSPDVQMALQQMVTKMKPYVDKLDQPLEKIQFIVKLTSMLNLDPKRFPQLIQQLKTANATSFNIPNSSQTNVSTTTVATNENIKHKKVIKTIKVKDLK